MRVRTSLNQIWALTKKDFFTWNTYKSQVFTDLTGAAIGLFSWAVLGTYRNRPVPEYGNVDYLTFLVVGVLIANFTLPLAQGLEKRINPWTIETVFMTGLGRPVFVVGSLTWLYTFGVLTFIPQLLVAILLFGVKLNVNPLSAVFAFAITTAMIFSLAMLDMGIRLVTKSKDPVMWVLTIGQQLAAGMIFPVQVLDKFVPGISTYTWIIPYTWIYHVVRLSTLTGASIFDAPVGFAFLEAAIFALILIPFCYFVLRWGIDRAKRDGTLGWY